MAEHARPGEEVRRDGPRRLRAQDGAPQRGVVPSDQYEAGAAPPADPAAANCTGCGRAGLIAHAAIWRTKPIAAAIKSGRAYVPKPSLEPRNLDALVEKVPIPRLRPDECHAHSARAA